MTKVVYNTYIYILLEYRPILLDEIVTSRFYL